MAIDLATVRLAKPRGRLDQRVKHRLQVESRAADGLEHVGGRGLLLQRLAELSEQAGVLDSDNGLAGEVLDQLDLLVGERADLLAVDVDVANQLVLFEHRNEEKGSRRGKFDDADSRRIALLIGKLLGVVGNVNKVLRSHHTAESIVRVGINQRVTLSGLGEGGWRIMHRGNAEGIVFAELQSGEIGPANAHRVLQHSLEYRL